MSIKRLLRATLTAALTTAFTIPLHVNAEISSKIKMKADNIAASGSVAAGFSAVSKSKLSENQVISEFEGLGKEVLAAAKKWGADGELIDSPPAFRRFLFFDYLTRGTPIIAAASNPNDLLVNGDASVEIIFEDEGLVAAANDMMDKKIDSPQYQEVGEYILAGYPMMPTGAKAQKCISCHASEEVGRPYPEGHKILGYTFVAIPK